MDPHRSVSACMGLASVTYILGDMVPIFGRLRMLNNMPWKMKRMRDETCVAVDPYCSLMSLRR